MLTGPVGVLVRADRADRRQPPDLRHRRRARRGARPRAGRRAGWRCCRSSASCAATSPARAGRTTRRPARSRGSSCPAGLRESERLPEPIFTPSTKAEVGHDEAIDFERRGRAGRRPRAGRAGARRLARALLVRRRARARARRDPGRHEVRVRPRRRTATLVARRRGADARLLALLAGRRLRGRPRPAELRQAVRARLGVGERLGPQRRRRRRSPTTSSRARARATSRPTSASPASRSRPGCERDRGAA